MIDFNHSLNLAARPRAGRFLAVTEPLSGRKPVLILLMRLLLWITLLVLPGFDVHARMVFTNLYSFGSVVDTNGIPLDGATPIAGLVQGSDGNLYGTTQLGGTNNLGTLFTISLFGTLTSLYSFTGTNDGANPLAGLVQGNDGYFYGTTFGGGTNDSGTVFKISINGTLISLYSFNFTNADDGGFPTAGLVQASDGNFYGTTWGAPYGPDQWGSFFRISTNGTLTTLWDCNPRIAFGGGARPFAGLVQGSDGLLYGTTSDGGPLYGAVVQVSTNGGQWLGTVHSFGPSNGASPVAGLVQGSDGSFYGTTARGGTNDVGTVFQVTANGELTSLYSFSGANEGAYPLAGLVQGNDGKLYGTTLGGGSLGNGTVISWAQYLLPAGSVGSGTVFSINTNGTGFKTLYRFSAGGTNAFGVYTNSDGANPQAGLILVGNTLYGTTSSGGSSGDGTVFSLTLPGPQLTITASGTNVILSWPTNASNFTLQFTTNLVPPVAWSANVWNNNTDNTNLTAPVVTSGQNVVTNPICGSQMFYRLALAQNFGTDWLALRTAMKDAGALSYGHQTASFPGSSTSIDMFYLPVPASVVELANANPGLCRAAVSTSEGPAPGYGWLNEQGSFCKWEGLVGPQSAGSSVIVIFSPGTSPECVATGIIAAPGF